jgi:hypothetical protein
MIVAGEAKAHAHRLQDGAILQAPDGAVYLEVTHTTQIIHDNHRPVTLESDLWPVVRQRDYHPQAIRRVKD